MFQLTTELFSESPYPSCTGMPRSSNSRSRSGWTGAPPQQTNGTSSVPKTAGETALPVASAAFAAVASAPASAGVATRAVGRAARR